MSADIESLPPSEIATGSNPNAAVVWLHGLGTDGSDLMPIARGLHIPTDLPINFIFPHAPKRPITLYGGQTMRAWYDIRTPFSSGEATDAHVYESQRAIEQVLDREIRRGIPAARIVLAGFSQGGLMALHTGLRYADCLGGVIALSAYLTAPERLRYEVHPATKDIPIFMAHGVHDNVVPLGLGKSTRDHLTSLGYTIQWNEYQMAHAVSAEEIHAIDLWLRSCFRASESIGGAGRGGWKEQ